MHKQTVALGYLNINHQRFVNPSKNENVSRYSMPLFIHPNSDAMLDKYTRADQFLNDRLKEIGLKE